MSEENLVLRSAILRQKGYQVVTTRSIEQAQAKLHEIDIAVLDYHLGAGKFGTAVAKTLRRDRPQVPIIVLSATLERKFGGIADMHLLRDTVRWRTCWTRCVLSRPRSAADQWSSMRATSI